MDYWLTKGGGWDFDRYRADFPWDAATATTSQTGNPALEPLRATSLPEWKAQAAELRRALDAILGPMPPGTAPPDARILEEAPRNGYHQLKVSYRADAEEEIPAYLLLPHKRRRTQRPNDPITQSPAIICLHQTVPWGKCEPCGLEPQGNPDLAYARELAQRGFVCLAPDAICFGERYHAGDPYAHYGDAVAFFGRHPAWSVMGKMAFDVARAADYLQSLPCVNPDAIGCIGHSHGAYGTLFAMLYEPRIRAGVQSCGFTALRSDPNPERWWRRTALMPRLGWFEEDIAQTPFDFHHLLALAAPRAQFLSCALADDIFPNTDNIGQIVEEARKVYALHGCPDALDAHVFEGSHRFPEDARRKAYDFLERHLRG
jgi:dienelactone hydrolase